MLKTKETGLSLFWKHSPGIGSFRTHLHTSHMSASGCHPQGVHTGPGAPRLTSLELLTPEESTLMVFKDTHTQPHSSQFQIFLYLLPLMIIPVPFRLSQNTGSRNQRRETGKQENHTNSNNKVTAFRRWTASQLYMIQQWPSWHWPTPGSQPVGKQEGGALTSSLTW